MSAGGAEAPVPAIACSGALVDYEGLAASGIWAEGAAPDVRTLQRWVAARRIPHFRLGRLVRFDVGMVREHILRTMVVQPIVARSGNVRRKYQRRARQQRREAVEVGA